MRWTCVSCSTMTPSTSARGWSRPDRCGRRSDGATTTARPSICWSRSTPTSIAGRRRPSASPPPASGSITTTPATTRTPPTRASTRCGAARSPATPPAGPPSCASRSRSSGSTSAARRSGGSTSSGACRRTTRKCSGRWCPGRRTGGRRCSATCTASTASGRAGGSSCCPTSPAPRPCSARATRSIPSRRRPISTGGSASTLKIGLGSNLTLEATVNPDFGQVEADPAEVNLSAVETFFDERRPFFLEGSRSALRLRQQLLLLTPHRRRPARPARQAISSISRARRRFSERPS